MPYTALAVGFLLIAILLGLLSPVAHRPWLAAGIALAMVATQFAVLMSP